MEGEDGRFRSSLYEQNCRSCQDLQYQVLHKVIDQTRQTRSLAALVDEVGFLGWLGLRPPHQERQLHRTRAKNLVSSLAAHILFDGLKNTSIQLQR